MGGGWIRALSGRARLTAQAEGCQVVGRNLRPAQSCGLLASPRIHHPSHKEKPHPKQTFGLFRVGFGGRGCLLRFPASGSPPQGLPLRAKARPVGS